MVNKKAAGLVTAVILCLMQMAVCAGELYSVDVKQVYCFSDILRVYADIEDVSGNPADKPSEIAGYIDGNKLTARSIERFGDTAEGVADIFLVDVSGSIRNNQMVQVKEAIKTWAANMKENDRIAVITFGEEINCIVDYSNNIQQINTAVDSITNHDMQTRLFGGISEGLKLATRNDSGLPKRKNIILITDGVNDYKGGVSENDVYTELKESLVPVYSMWMSGSAGNSSKGRAVLNSVTEYSGGELYDMSNKQIDVVYDWIYQSIRNSYTIDFTYSSTNADDGKHTFSIKTAQNNKVAEDSVEFTYRKSDENSGSYSLTDITEEESGSEDNSRKMLIILAAAVVLLAVGAGTVIYIITSKKKNNSFQAMDTMISGQEYFGGESMYGSIENNDKSYQTYDATVNIAENANNKEVIIISMSDGTEKRVPFDGSIKIGRGPANDVVLDDSLVSGQHCAITASGVNLYAEDLGSTNGTVLNGIRINGKMPIKNNDILRLGNKEYMVKFNF